APAFAGTSAPVVLLLLSGAELLSYQECQLQRLHVVEARITQRLVARRQRLFINVLGATEALGDVVARELDVDATGVRSCGTVRLEKALNFVHNIIESARLVAV